MPENHIYIHYPYCLYKCHYCDFNSHAYEEKEIPQSSYARALKHEIRWRHRTFEREGHSFLIPGSRITSIFFGGGTPSLMPPSEVEDILQELQKLFRFDSQIEITLESNPGTVTAQKFSEFRQAGINRVSLGLQSLNDKFLKSFGRIHSAEQGLQAIAAAQESGIPRVSADLIFGFPGQTLQEWQSDVESILHCGLKHVSCYALTAEEGTHYTAQLKKGVLQETDPELFADMQEFTYSRFASAALPAYEISNFAEPCERSRHNMGYWKFHSYAGLGAGAWSNFVAPQKAVSRQMNHKAPEHYMRTVSEETGFFTNETIPLPTAMIEFVMMGLRLQEGLCADEFHTLFNRDFEAVFDSAIRRNLAQGRLKRHARGFAPTQTGFLFNNALVSDFFDVIKTS